MTDKEKDSLIAQLIKMAWADSEHRDSEKMLIYTMANMLGLTEERVDQLYREYIEFTPPKFVFDRIVQFHRMVLLTNVDMHVDSNEKTQLRRAGLLLGLNNEGVDEVIREMNLHDNGMIPAERMMEIFEKSFN